MSVTDCVYVEEGDLYYLLDVALERGDDDLVSALLALNMFYETIGYNMYISQFTVTWNTSEPKRSKRDG
jgi:hypothetical protein